MEASTAISTEFLAPRLPCLGAIKLGGKKAGQKYPEKFDSFVIVTRMRGPDGNFVRDAEVHRRLGTEKPMELDVRLPFETPAQNFYAQMLAYQGKTRLSECDGESCRSMQTGTIAVCSRRQGRECACKPYGRLSVILEAASTFGGVHVFRTTSWESVNSLQSAVRMFYQQFGSLRGLPLKLVCYPAEVRFKGADGQEATGTALKVGLVLRATYEEASQVALEFHRTNALARREILQLAAGVSAELAAIDADEAGIGEEFFPDARRIAPPRQDPGLDRVAALNAEIPGAGAPTAASDPNAPLTRGEVRTLERLRKEATDAGLLTHDDQANLDEILAVRDAVKIRSWISSLQNDVLNAGTRRS